MLDERTKKNISTLLPSVQQAFTQFMLDAQKRAANFGYQYIAIQGTRTWAQQDKLYAQGRSTPGKIVTNAKPGSSYHNFGLAIDCGVFQNGKYLDGSAIKLEQAEAIKIHKMIAENAINYKLRWGGTFKMRDFPHFEYNTQTTLIDLNNMHAKGLPTTIRT